MRYPFLVSIICPAYNHESFIERTIQSILRQTYRNFEIVIVDDKSTDNTLVVAKRYTNQNYNIKCIQNDYNMGLSRTLNKGIGFSSGEIICILATDDELKPDHIEKCVTLFSEYKHIGAVYSSIEIIDENDSIIGYSENCTLNRYQLLRSLFIDGNCNLAAPGSCFLRSLFNQIGMFHTSLIQTQDYEFNVRVLANTEIAINNEKTVRYRRMNLNRNLSSSTSWGKMARELEMNTVLDSFISNLSPSLFRNVFPEIPLLNDNFYYMEYVCISMIMEKNETYYKNWALLRMIKLLSNCDSLDIIHSNFQFSNTDHITMYKNFADWVNSVTHETVSKKNIISSVKKMIRRLLNARSNTNQPSKES